MASTLVRRLSVPAALLMAGAGLLMGPAATAAESDNRPALSASGSVDGDDVTFSYSINRGAHQIAAQACTLDAAPVPCDTTPGDGSSKSLSSYDISFTDLTTGQHQFQVTVTLTDGGQAVEAATVEVAGVTLQQACTSVGGTLADWSGLFDTPGAWGCSGVPFAGSVDMGVRYAGISELLRPYCTLRFTSGVTALDYTQAGWACTPNG